MFTTYNAAGGQWQRLAVADLTRGGVDTLRAMLSEGSAQLVYSDPPWNPGNEKYWRNHAKLPAPRAYDDLLDAWCAAVVAAQPEHVLVEHSVIAEHQAMLLAAIARCQGWRWQRVRTYTVQYGSPKRPNALLHFGPAPLTTDPSGMSGEAMTRCAFKGTGIARGSVVVDPCTGLGTTSRVAHAFGCHFVGTELCDDRLARTAAWLTKRGYRADGESAEAAQGASSCASAAAIVESIDALATLPETERVAAYNEIQRALGKLVADVTHGDPASQPQLIAASSVRANDYNPNRVASVEMDLLEQSMRADGITMNVVVMRDGDGAVVVDGFHRTTVGRERLGRRYLPCSVIDRPLADRMASTVRHNRARGKHQVDLMAGIVRNMMALGWSDERVAAALGMSVEESLRLRQMVGAARALAADHYEREWRVVDDGDGDGVAPAEELAS